MAERNGSEFDGERDPFQFALDLIRGLSEAGTEENRPALLLIGAAVARALGEESLLKQFGELPTAPAREEGPIFYCDNRLHPY